MGDATTHWPTFMTRLKSREDVAEDTVAFHFEKPAGFNFTAGQFIDVELLNPADTDTAGNIRAFSISSAPCEDTLMITTRLRDTSFKRVLRTMSPGTEVRIEGPFGNLRLHSSVKHTAVFLAENIGITPFRSIVLDASYRKLPQQIFLFFSDRRPEDAPFLDELQAIEKQNANYRFVGTMTEMERSDLLWEGECGCIDKAMLDRHLESASLPIYYIAGPPVVVNALHNMLRENHVEDDCIRVEEFAGY